MSSAISPYEVIARLPGPISTKDVEEVVAKTPKDSKLSKEEVVRELGQIVETNFFGDKTPKLADDLKADIAKLAPAKEPGAMNNMAAAFAAVIWPQPAPGGIYRDAHFLQSAVTGAIVAMHAEIAADTPEQAGDKKALIDAYSNNIATLEALTMFNGLWSAFALQTPGEKPGTFVLPHEVAGPMAESIALGDMTPEFKQVLQAKLAADQAKAPSPEQVDQAQAAKKLNATRPIGGKTEEQLQAIYKKATSEAKTQRIVHAPETFRPEKYQKLLNVLNESPLTEILKPILREAIGRFNIQSRRQQKAQYTEITGANHDRVNDKQLQAIRQVALRVAERMGAGDPSVTRVAQGVLNAWVSSVDLDNPHITYFSHLQDIVWDGEKGDWLKFHVDANGEFCDADAPGAQVISGESLVEVVFAHELTHISEGAVLNQYLMSILLGVSLKDNPSLHGEGCVCAGCSTIAEKTELAAEVMGDSNLNKFINSGEFRELRSQVMEQIPSLKFAFANMNSSDPAAKASANAGLESFQLMFTREGESTADFGAVRIMGPNGPRLMAMAFDIVNRNTGKGSPAERLQEFKASWSRKHKEEMEFKLEESEDNGALSHAQFATATTHPTAMLRAIGNFDHAKRPDTQAVWKFEAMPTRLRILGAAQAHDMVIEKLEDAHADFQHGSADHMAPEQIMKTLEDQHTKRAIRKEYERMRIITKEIAQLIFDDGIKLGEGGAVPYAVMVASFIKAGGAEIFRHQASGGGNPLAALLGGGDEPAPQCVKMSGQLADELERIVDAANVPEKELGEWMAVVQAFRTFADEDSNKAARISRTKQKASARAMRSLR